MTDPLEPLIVDLLLWLSRAPRPYHEVMEAWRTSCPRLPIWEEANARGLIDRMHRAGEHALVGVSLTGRRLIEGQAVSSLADRFGSEGGSYGSTNGSKNGSEKGSKNGAEKV